MNTSQSFESLCQQMAQLAPRLQYLEQVERCLFADPRKALLHGLDEAQLAAVIPYFEHSVSQLAQDLFVIAELLGKRNGFFVEFGATNGLELSNSLLLERQLGWQGILAEPARFWHEALLSNRTCSIETKCLWSESGQTLNFLESGQEGKKDYHAMLSTVKEFAEGDLNTPERMRNFEEYQVQTISLNQMLSDHRAPKEIDFLSADTEGSEYIILSGLDFSKYRIKVITVEHAWREPTRQQLFELLSENGYERKHTLISRFDDWYVLKE
jgi:FkbM family methyltransferase